MPCRSKWAASSTIVSVSGTISEPAPPITPAIPFGPAASAITSMSPVSVRGLPSSVVIVSPGRARRAVSSPPGIFVAS